MNIPNFDDEFEYLTDGDPANLTPTGLARRDGLRVTLTQRVRERGRRRRRRQVLAASGTLCVALGIALASLREDPRPSDTPRVATAITDRHNFWLPLRGASQVVVVEDPPAIVEMLRAPVRAAPSSPLFAAPLDDSELSAWLVAAGHTPGRLRIGGQSHVFDIERASTKPTE
ncbi:MAG: hypothetical protein H6832_07090 [Planctomycetes bacterium]|nr:hypothetical protein [Planctomycetota bacterium]MCB9890335.1 hypothetical protein [Planctomycetota bacterium]MCB9918153.1 hypothetical protein [Planctomycetota bacterium]